MLVIGAGAAGLAAAAELAGAGRSVCVLEAREQIGGRILTRREPGLPLPLELGAEFVHGRPAETLEWLRKAGVPIVDVAKSRFGLRGKRLHSGGGLFEEMRRALNRVGRPAADLPFGDFLEGPARDKLSPHLRAFARTLVEGFDAADATLASTLDTLEGLSGEGAADSPSFRPLGGYAALIDAMAALLHPEVVRIRLGAVVDEVQWRRGAAAVGGTQHGRRFRVGAPCVIFTVPLGVLLQPPEAPGAIRFSPPLDGKQQALSGLAQGDVLKVLLRFRTPFWEEIDRGRYRDASFFHGPKLSFPTFWTSLPVRSAVLTAWVGGPRASRLAGLGTAGAADAALESLEALFGGRADPRSALEAVYMHDWQRDPFARGAYSYVRAGGVGAREALAAPLNDTMFFAGEAAATGGASATVAGALASGRRAAWEVLAASGAGRGSTRRSLSRR